LKKIRIAFLTNEFVIENPSSGGLASYLNRITRALYDLGCEPEIFVQKRLLDTPIVSDHGGIRVEHVPPRQGFIIRLSRYLEGRFLQSPWSGSTGFLAASWALAKVVEARHARQPFDIVHSASVGACGLFVRRLPGRPHLIRLSSDRELLFELEGLNTIGGRLMARLERLALRRADTAYAPSQFLADYCRDYHGNNIQVLRPPLFLDATPFDSVPLSLQGKYLIHFGRLGTIKGSDILAKALCLVWQQEPDFRMIWAGKVSKPGDYEACHLLWGGFAKNVQWLGPLEKKLLYTLIKGAVASVLPSRVDNLPNTVIESLILGVPVVGSKGASIDELVEPGVNGDLVPIGDEVALAEVMLRVWRGEVDWLGEGFRQPPVLKQLEPEVAARGLISLAGLSL
jgi:glycosyltransferase involved in cell wall biosynthesis